jgi:hypothetical protein
LLPCSLKSFFLLLLENAIAKKINSPETWGFFGGKKGDTCLVDSAENELCIQTKCLRHSMVSTRRRWLPSKSKIQ